MLSESEEDEDHDEEEVVVVVLDGQEVVRMRRGFELEELVSGC